MLVRILYAAVALTLLGVFPREAYRAADRPSPPAAMGPAVATAPAIGPAHAVGCP